ncbi:hypothetical protein C479_00350 [Halovivax asiaticus JCM 14624]|uniref:Uncharacterized protein n=1 Tax=Halovivax asiaticus JCM 14624 TaxID=1227490 RepID=M0BW22_9EURY|nr:hypothetical protein [Halovivax asiaticus]ELZ14312.1 hypothetical protein C479_00350 [Halovivax asiaticus JCM 14624]
MKRRALLSSLTATTVLVGGCLDSQGDPDEPDDGSSDMDTGGCDNGTSLAIDPVSAEGLVESITVSRAEIKTADPTLRIPRLSERIDRVLDGEPTTIEVDRAPPLQPSPYVRRGETVYTFDATITDAESITGPKYRVTETSYHEIRDEERTQSTALPDPDLWRLVEGIRSSTDTFVAAYLDQSARDESILAGGQDRLVVEFPDEIEHFGRYFVVERIGTRSSTIERTRYVSRQIGDQNAFETHFLDTYGITLENPDEDVRTLLDDAIDADGLEFCAEYDGESDDAFYTSALETLESHLQSVDRMGQDTRDVFSLPHGGAHYIEYEGTWYALQPVEWVV